MRTLWVIALVLAGISVSRSAAKYDGPRPPKPDVPYLLHADNLIETEIQEAKEEERRNEVVAWVNGPSSPVRTPLAEPIFLFESDKIAPGKLQLYKFEVRSGRRQVVLPKRASKGGSRPLRLNITQIEGKLYRIEANEYLENGEYSLSPEGSNQVFCFQVY
jgi:hypothetical protein